MITKVKVQVFWETYENGGRKRAVNCDCYSSTIYFVDDSDIKLHSAIFTFLQSSDDCHMSFLVPENVQEYLVPDSLFWITEGSRNVAIGKIVEILEVEEKPKVDKIRLHFTWENGIDAEPVLCLIDVNKLRDDNTLTAKGKSVRAALLDYIDSNKRYYESTLLNVIYENEDDFDLYNYQIEDEIETLTIESWKEP